MRQYKKKKCSEEITNQGVTVNLPLASANCSSADADALSYSSTLRIGLEKKRILRDIRLSSHIEAEMPTGLPFLKRCR
jgi:hypothetical protein